MNTVHEDLHTVRHTSEAHPSKHLAQEKRFQIKLVHNNKHKCYAGCISSKYARNVKNAYISKVIVLPKAAFTVITHYVCSKTLIKHKYIFICKSNSLVILRCEIPIVPVEHTKIRTLSINTQFLL